MFTDKLANFQATEKQNRTKPQPISFLMELECAFAKKPSLTFARVKCLLTCFNSILVELLSFMEGYDLGVFNEYQVLYFVDLHSRIPLA